MSISTIPLISDIRHDQARLQEQKQAISLQIQLVCNALNAITTPEDYRKTQDHLIQLQDEIAQLPREPFGSEEVFQLKTALKGLQRALKEKDPNAWKVDWAARTALCGVIATYFALWVHPQERAFDYSHINLRELSPWSYGISTAILGMSGALFIEKVIPRILSTITRPLIQTVQSNA